MDIDPIVRLMVVCEDVQVSPGSPESVDLLGLMHAIRSREDPAFPLLHPGLCVFLQITGRGRGKARVVGVAADTERPIFASPTHHLDLGSDPLAVRGLVFRLRGCIFPGPGLYYIQFRYNEKVVAQQTLTLR